MSLLPTAMSARRAAPLAAVLGFAGLTALVALVAFSVPHDVTAAPRGAVAARPDLTLTGTVTADDRPLAGANVSVDGTSIGTATDAAGRFALRGVPDDAVALRVTASGYAPRVEPVSGRDAVRIALVVVAEESAAVADEPEAHFDGVLAPSPAAPPRSATAGIAADATGGAAPARSRTERSAEAPPDGPAARRPAPGWQAPRGGVLTAGDVDDGLNWEAFLRYVRRTLGGQTDGLPDLDLDRRVTLSVVDASGRPVAGARVRVEAEGGSRARRLVTETGTDGRLALFPAYDFGPGVRRLRVTASAPGQPDLSASTLLTRLDDDRMARIELPTRRATRPNALDLAFVVDVTGSMGDEMSYLSREFQSIVRRVESAHPGVDLRFGLVVYRDHGDAFVVRRWDFTRSVDEMQDRLASVHAGGGGDYPEAMDEALDATLDLDWRTGTAARVAFLVADAPPHAEDYDATMAHVREARARGLRLYSVTASGAADEAEYVMRAMSALTQARHLFLTDDSGVGNPHAEPHVPCYQVTALDDLLVRVVAGELAGRRVEADPQTVVRESGQQTAGVCHDGDVISQRPDEQTGRRGGDLGYD